MKDFLDNELKVGDEVVFVQLGYRNFLRGKIKSMTAKTILIGHPETNTCSTETKQTGSQVIRVAKTVPLNILDVLKLGMVSVPLTGQIVDNQPQAIEAEHVLSHIKVVIPASCERTQHKKIGLIKKMFEAVEGETNYA